MANEFISGAHHIAIKCASVEEFLADVAFWTEAIGLDVYRSAGEGDDAMAMLTCGNTMLEIFATGKELQGNGSVNHFALACSDVDAVVEAARAAGAPITMEPREIVIKSEPPMPARIAFFEGPAGESVELFDEH